MTHVIRHSGAVLGIAQKVVLRQGEPGTPAAGFFQLLRKGLAAHTRDPIATGSVAMPLGPAMDVGASAAVRKWVSALVFAPSSWLVSAEERAMLLSARESAPGALSLREDEETFWRAIAVAPQEWRIERPHLWSMLNSTTHARTLSTAEDRRGVASDAPQAQGKGAQAQVPTAQNLRGDASTSSQLSPRLELRGHSNRGAGVTLRPAQGGQSPDPSPGTLQDLAVRTAAGHRAGELAPLGPAKEARITCSAEAPARGTPADLASSQNAQEAGPVIGQATSARRENVAVDPQRPERVVGPAVPKRSQGGAHERVHTRAEVEAYTEANDFPSKDASANVSHQGVGKMPSERASELSLRTSGSGSPAVADPLPSVHSQSFLPEGQAAPMVEGAPVGVGRVRLALSRVPDAVEKGQQGKEAAIDARTGLHSLPHKPLAKAGKPSHVTTAPMPQAERRPANPTAVSERGADDARSKRGAPGLEAVGGKVHADNPRLAPAVVMGELPIAKGAPAPNVNPNGKGTPRKSQQVAGATTQLPLTVHQAHHLSENTGRRDWHSRPMGTLDVGLARGAKESGAIAGKPSVGDMPTPLKGQDRWAESASAEAPTDRSHRPEGWGYTIPQQVGSNFLRAQAAQSRRSSTAAEPATVNKRLDGIARGEQAEQLPSDAPLQHAKESGRALSHSGQDALRESDTPMDQPGDIGQGVASSSYKSFRASHVPVQEVKSSGKANRPLPPSAAAPSLAQRIDGQPQSVGEFSQPDRVATSLGRVAREPGPPSQRAAPNAKPEAGEPLPWTLARRQAMSPPVDGGQGARRKDDARSAWPPTSDEFNGRLRRVKALGGALTGEGLPQDAGSIAGAETVSDAQQKKGQIERSVPGQRGAGAPPAHGGPASASAGADQLALDEAEQKVRAAVDAATVGDIPVAKKVKEPNVKAVGSPPKWSSQATFAPEESRQRGRDGAELRRQVAPTAPQETTRGAARSAAVSAPPEAEVRGQRLQVVLSSSRASRSVSGKQRARSTTDSALQFGANGQVDAAGVHLGQKTSICAREDVQRLAAEDASPSSAREVAPELSGARTPQSSAPAMPRQHLWTPPSFAKGERKSDLAIPPTQTGEEARVDHLGVTSSDQKPLLTQDTLAVPESQPEVNKKWSAQLNGGRAETRGAANEKNAASARKQDSPPTHMARQRLHREDDSVGLPLSLALAAEQPVGGASSGQWETAGKTNRGTSAAHTPLRQEYLAFGIEMDASRPGRIDPPLQEAWLVMRPGPRGQRPSVVGPWPAGARSDLARRHKEQPPEPPMRDPELTGINPSKQAAPPYEETGYPAKENLTSPPSGHENRAPSADVWAPGLVRKGQGFPGSERMHAAPAATQPDLRPGALPPFAITIERGAPGVHSHSNDRPSAARLSSHTPGHRGGPNEPKVDAQEDGSPNSAAKDNARQVNTAPFVQSAEAKTSSTPLGVASRPKEEMQAWRSEQVQAIARELAQSLKHMVRAEETRLRVTIAQSELGRIAVDLTKHDKTVSAQFRVESPQTQALLESSFSELRTVLGEQGLQLGELSVAVEQRGEGGQGWHKPEESASYAPDAAHPAPAGPREARREPPRPRLFGYNTIEITA